MVFTQIWYLHKSAVWDRNNILANYAEFTPNDEIIRFDGTDFQSAEKVFKTCTTTKLQANQFSRIKVKSAYFRHIFDNNFFRIEFVQLFQWIRNQQKIQLFW